MEENEVTVIEDSEGEEEVRDYIIALPCVKNLKLELRYLRLPCILAKCCIYFQKEEKDEEVIPDSEGEEEKEEDEITVVAVR